MEEGCFSGIIEAEKEDLGLLLPETEGGQNAIEPVNEEHWRSGLKADRRGSMSPIQQSECLRPSICCPENNLGIGNWEFRRRR